MEAVEIPVEQVVVHYSHRSPAEVGVDFQVVAGCTGHLALHIRHHNLPAEVGMHLAYEAHHSPFQKLLLEVELEL